jgi:hypothetical protein
MYERGGKSQREGRERHEVAKARTNGERNGHEEGTEDDIW